MLPIGQAIGSIESNILACIEASAQAFADCTLR